MKNLVLVCGSKYNNVCYSCIFCHFQEIANSAVLGAAYQAKHGLSGGETDFSVLTDTVPPPALVCNPFKDASQVYDPMVARYRKLVLEVVKTQV